MQERIKEGASLYVTYDSMKRPVHISIKESGLSGFLAFMREDTAEVLRQGYDPNLWMCHYRFPDRRQIPEIRPQSNDDYLERLSRAARSAGIRAEHQIAMTDMLYCLRHSIVPLDTRGRSRKAGPADGLPRSARHLRRGTALSGGRHSGIQGLYRRRDGSRRRIFQRYAAREDAVRKIHGLPCVELFQSGAADALAEDLRRDRPACGYGPDNGPVLCRSGGRTGAQKPFRGGVRRPGTAPAGKSPPGVRHASLDGKLLRLFAAGRTGRGKEKETGRPLLPRTVGTVPGGREAEGTGRSRMRGKPLLYGRQRRENAPDTKTINAYEYTSHSRRSLLTLAPDQTASRVQIYTDGFTRKDFDRYAAADISDARNDPDGPQDAWIVRYDFSDQRKIPRIGENPHAEDYARSLLRRAHESRIRPCCIIPLRDLMFCAESGIDPRSPRRGRTSG